LKHFVIDASVGVKWLNAFKHEPLVDKARWCLDQRNAGRLSLLVPDLFWAEVANVLWKASRHGLCRQDEAAAALSGLEALELPSVASRILADSAMTIALSHGRSAYDSLYVALALHSNAELITADEKLANAMAAYFPVKWLGSI